MERRASARRLRYELSVMDEILKRLKQLSDEIDGEVTDRGRVIDDLLDLRGEGEGAGALLAAIDVALTELPGQTVVPNEWWRSTLESLGAAALLAGETSRAV
ncbi:MAG: hypothetical protein GY698_21215 [Actinomycetia bacterium]|nr:hypothetical protein [Actinomycetes bacterium]